MESIKLPQGIIEIPGAFLPYNYVLDTILIPDNVIRIGGQAFQMDYLKYIRLPKNLKKIDWYAFEANDIEDIILPETLEFIGRGAFSTIEYLKKVYCKAQNPPTAELDPMNYNTGPFHWSGEYCTLYVPVGSGDLYRNAEGWQDFYQIVETNDFPSDCGIVFASDCKARSFSGEIIINNPTGTPLDIHVYDINGKMVWQGKVAETSNITVAPGIYLVRMGNKTQKILVK